MPNGDWALGRNVFEGVAVTGGSQDVKRGQFWQILPDRVT